MSSFIAKVLNAKYKDLFTARLGTALLLKKWAIAGVGGTILTPIIAGIIGLIIESGIFILDLTLDSLIEGMKLEEFEKEAGKAYAHASSKVHTPEEKEKIRKQYLDIITKFGDLGLRGKRDDSKSRDMRGDPLP